MDMCIRRFGVHRGAPRLYFDTLALLRAGFAPGTPFKVAADLAAGRVTITAGADGTRRVSRKLRGQAEVPVIDLNSLEDLRPLANLDQVRVIFLAGVIHILALASHRKALERLKRLQARVGQRQPLRTASIAFGAGITSWALHAGLQDAGVATNLVMANELDAQIAEVGLANNPLLTSGTAVLNAPMQELAADAWALGGLPAVELLEAGIPCAGASKAGVSKRRLGQMEDHPLVGHLVASVIQWIAALQPAIFFAENVPDYQSSASAAILRGWLRDAGYAVQEAVLDASDFGSLEGRVRWFLVAHPPGLQLSLADLAPARPPKPVLADVLEPVPADHSSYRAVTYLKAKAERDAGKGSGFAMQWVEPGSTRVPTLRKGYHKGGSTDVRLRHPEVPELSRLLTSGEHAAIKGIPARIVAGLSQSMAHAVCGQSVDVRPVRAIGERLGMALRAMPAEAQVLAAQPRSRTLKAAA